MNRNSCQGLRQFRIPRPGLSRWDVVKLFVFVYARKGGRHSFLHCERGQACFLALRTGTIYPDKVGPQGKRSAGLSALIFTNGRAWFGQPMRGEPRPTLAYQNSANSVNSVKEP